MSISEHQFGNLSSGTVLAPVALKCEDPHVGCKQPPQGDNKKNIPHGDICCFNKNANISDCFLLHYMHLLLVTGLTAYQTRSIFFDLHW